MSGHGSATMARHVLTCRGAARVTVASFRDRGPLGERGRAERGQSGGRGTRSQE